MPVYVLSCDACETVAEIVSTIDERPSQAPCSCGSTMTRNFTLEGKTSSLDTIVGGEYRSDLPYPEGFIPTQDPDPGKRWDHAQRNARYFSKSAMNEAVKKHNREYEGRPNLQIHESSLHDVWRHAGIDPKNARELARAHGL